jgi:Fur family transcriptional regulator, peroxide stress response regulator
MEQYEKMVEKLKENGCRITPQRLGILKVISKYKGKHPSLNDLMKDVKKSMPTVSFSTLYNTVMKFEEMRLISIFNIGRETRIDMETEPHINIIDRKSGRIDDLHDRELIKILEKRMKGRKIVVNIITY